MNKLKPFTKQTQQIRTKKLAGKEEHQTGHTVIEHVKQLEINEHRVEFGVEAEIHAV